MLFGYNTRFQDVLSRQLTENSETYKVPEELREKVRQRIEKEQKDAKARYDKKRVKNVKYQIGDIVFMSRKSEGTGESTKHIGCKD